MCRWMSALAITALCCCPSVFPAWDNSRLEGLMSLANEQLPTVAVE